MEIKVEAQSIHEIVQSVEECLRVNRVKKAKRIIENNAQLLASNNDEMRYIFGCVVAQNEADMLEWLIDNGYSEVLDETDQDSVCDIAAENGSLECLEVLYCEDFSWSLSTPLAAATFGQLECLQFAIDNGCYHNSDVIHHAVMFGQLDAVELCIINALDYDELQCTQAAAEYGHLDILQLLHSKEFEWDAGATTIAWKKKHFDCFLYLISEGCDFEHTEIFLSLALDETHVNFDIPNLRFFLFDLAAHTASLHHDVPHLHTFQRIIKGVKQRIEEQAKAISTNACLPADVVTYGVKPFL